MQISLRLSLMVLKQYNNAMKELLTKGSVDLTDDEITKESIKDNETMIGGGDFNDNEIIDNGIS